MKHHNSGLLPRVIAGSARGIRLHVPESARPITDRMKQSLFDTLSTLVHNANVLDLFAGAGSLGIEALSRGATHCTFVEIDDTALETIDHNLLNTNLSDKATVAAQPMYNFLRETKNVFDIIFVDPPFTNLDKPLPMTLLRDHLSENGVIIIKMPRRHDTHLVQGISVVHTDNFGSNKLVYIRKIEQSNA